MKTRIVKRMAALLALILLAGLLTEGLARRGFRLFLNRLLPPGDGGIAYGQACWGARLLALGKAQGA